MKKTPNIFRVNSVIAAVSTTAVFAAPAECLPSITQIEEIPELANARSACHINPYELMIHSFDPKASENFRRAIANTHWLFQPNDQNKLVLIIQIDKQGIVHFNPRIVSAGIYYEYKEIPPVSQMSQDFCDLFFGKPVFCDKDCRVYSLIEKSSPGRENKWVLKLKFRQGLVDQYKLKGPKYASKAWTTAGGNLEQHWKKYRLRGYQINLSEWQSVD